MSQNELKAYHIQDNHEGSAVVIFANKNVVARREGANELNVEFADVSCHRLPWADKYGSVDEIPTTEFLEHGHYAVCPYCEKYISEDDKYITDKANNALFCSESCEKEYKK